MGRKPAKMDNKLRRLAVRMLELASYDFNKHTCEDMQEEDWKGFELEDRKAFLMDMHRANGSLEDYDPEDIHAAYSEIMWYVGTILEDEMISARYKDGDLS